MWPRIRLAGAAFLFSTGGTAIKSCSLSGWQIAGFRCGVAALVLMVLVPSSVRNWTRATWAVGVVYAATLVLFTLANRATTAASANFLQSSAPLYVVVIGHFLLGDRARKPDVVAMVFFLCGLLLVFGGGDAVSPTSPQPMVGNGLAAGAALAWALTIIGLGRLAASGTPAVGAVVAGNLIAFLATFPLTLPVQQPQMIDLALIVYLGLFQIALAYLLLTSAVGHLSAVEASLILALDPVLSPLWAWLVHSEIPSALTLIGGGLIVTAIVGRSWYQQRARRCAVSDEVRK